MSSPEFHAPDPPVLIRDCETDGTMDVSGIEIPGGSILSHRANGLDEGISVGQALSMSTAHGADCLGRSDGAISQGRRQIVADGRLTTVDRDEVVALAREVIRAR